MAEHVEERDTDYARDSGPVTTQQPPDPGSWMGLILGMVGGAVVGGFFLLVIASALTVDDPSPSACAVVLFFPAAGAAVGTLFGACAWNRTSPWAELMFWTVSGLLIGGLTPTAACCCAPRGEETRACLSTARKFVPPMALLGGIIGMSYGWGRPRRPPP